MTTFPAPFLRNVEIVRSSDEDVCIEEWHEAGLWDVLSGRMTGKVFALVLLYDWEWAKVIG